MPVILVNKLLPGMAVDTVLADTRRSRTARRGTAAGRGLRQARSRLERGASASLGGPSTHFVRARPDDGVPVRSGKTVHRLSRRLGTPRWRCSRKSPSMGFFASPICSHSVSWTPREAKFGRRVPDDLSVIRFANIPQPAGARTASRLSIAGCKALTSAVMDVLRRSHGTRRATACAHAGAGCKLVVRSTVRGLAAAEEPA